MRNPVRSAVSVALYLFQRLSILVIALFACALAAYSVACAAGAAVWVQLPLSVGGQVCLSVCLFVCHAASQR